MPLPFNDNYALDNLFYKAPFPKSMCIIHPNYITTLGNLFALLTFYFFMKNKLWLVLLFAFCKQLCDIYDGIIARKCKKTSKFGKIYDILSDTFYTVIILILTIMKVSYRFKWIKIICSFIIISFLYFTYHSYHSNYEEIDNSTITRIMHDNTIITVPLFTLIFYYISILF